MERQPIEVDTRQLGAELAASGNDALRLRIPDSRMIRIGVCKGQNGTVRHIKSPVFIIEADKDRI